jgi:hypothetical protein
VPETVKVPLGEDRIYLHIARQALDTHDAFCANALSEMDVSVLMAATRISRVACCLSRRNLLWFS